MKRFSYSILVLIISILSVSGQNNADAEKIINNLLASVKTTAIRTNFKLKITEKNALNSQSNSGTFTLMEKPNGLTWFKAMKFQLQNQQLRNLRQ